MRFILLSLVLFTGVLHAQTLGTSIGGTALEIDSEKSTHLVFFDIWQDGYADPSPWHHIQDLPENYRRDTQFIWIQPRINITDAQIKEFVANHRQFTPLLVDEDFSLMRRFQVWQTPVHVVVENESVVFKGDASDFDKFISSRE